MEKQRVIELALNFMKANLDSESLSEIFYDCTSSDDVTDWEKAIEEARPVAEAAPDLLEACKAAFDFLQHRAYELKHLGETQAQRDKLEQAIAKAEGK
jgi:hypothetical protein